MASAAAALHKLNLERSTVLVFDGDAMSMAITTQILSGFGAKNINRCDSLPVAMRTVMAADHDLIVVDPTTVGDEAYEFVRWLRRSGGEVSRFAPVLIVTGHTQLTRIGIARDSGANLVVSKPLTPLKLIQRIQWLSRDRRAHIECEAYAGPERRFKFIGPPQGCEGRRSDDFKGEIGDAQQPNMSQEDIDAMMQPSRVSI